MWNLNPGRKLWSFIFQEKYKGAQTFLETLRKIMEDVSYLFYLFFKFVRYFVFISSTQYFLFYFIIIKIQIQQLILKSLFYIFVATRQFARCICLDACGWQENCIPADSSQVDFLSFFITCGWYDSTCW